MLNLTGKEKPEPGGLGTVRLGQGAGGTVKGAGRLGLLSRWYLSKDLEVGG